MRERRPSDSPRWRRRVHAWGLRAVLAAGVATLAACPSPPPAPRDGVRPWEARARVSVPGGVLNAAGGGLALARTLLSIDTRLSPVPVVATHHGSNGSW